MNEYWADSMDCIGPGWVDRVSVVLVTFNSGHVIERALRSLPPGVEVVVVDNASTDDSLQRAKAAGALCVRCPSNVGFGRASNLGAARSSREFILFLNPDATLRPHAVEIMMAAALRHPGAGAVGPRLFDGDMRAVWRFASVLQPLPRGATLRPVEPDAACCVPLLTGAALMCRRTAFEDVGGFDENIFLYHEDDDLCLRLTRAGWSLVYEPDAEVAHAFGQSSGRSDLMARFKSEQRLLSLAYVSRKYDLAFDPAHELRRTIRRLLVAVITFDSSRRAAALGRLDALRCLRARAWTGNHADPESADSPALGSPGAEFAAVRRGVDR